MFEDFLRDLFGLAGLADDVAVEHLRAVVVAADPSAEQWLSLIAVPFGLEVEPSEAVRLLDDEFRKAELVRRVTSLFELLSTEPMMVTIEDTQWMDDASAELLEAIAGRLGASPLLIVLTRRETDTGFVLPDEHQPGRIVLEPLGPDALDALVVAVTPDTPLAQHVRAALVERCDGNPMFLLELVQAVVAGGDLETLPTSIEGLITARIDRLRTDDRVVLRYMSVLGAGFLAAYVDTVLPDGLAVSRAEALRRLDDFVTVDASGWVVFRHNLVRDVAYSGLPFRVRSSLHGRIADSILERLGEDVDDDAPLLSLHCHAAQRFGDSWRYSRLAGDRAREVFANVDASVLYERALEAARHLDDLAVDEQVRVLERLGDVQDLAGLVDDARESYALARRLCRDDAVAGAELNLKTAFIDERLGRYTRAMRSIRAGVRLLDDAGIDDAAGGGLRARLAVWSAVVRIGQGRYAEAVRDCDVGIRLAEQAGDDATLAQGYVTADYASASLGLADGHERSQRALDIYTRLGDLRGQATAANMLGTLAYYEGRWDEAADFYRRSRDAREQMGDPANAAVATANLAELLVEQGRIEEAGADLRGAGGHLVEHRRRVGHRLQPSGCGASAGRAAISSSRPRSSWATPARRSTRWGPGARSSAPMCASPRCGCSRSGTRRRWRSSSRCATPTSPSWAAITWCQRSTGCAAPRSGQQAATAPAISMPRSTQRVKPAPTTRSPWRSTRSIAADRRGRSTDRRRTTRRAHRDRHPPWHRTTPRLVRSGGLPPDSAENAHRGRALRTRPRSVTR